MLRCSGNEKGTWQVFRIMQDEQQSCTPASRTGIPACPRFHALAACPLNAGKNTSSTNVSNVVGVVFFADRGSSAFMYPLLIAADISQSSSAIFLEIRSE